MAIPGHFFLGFLIAIVVPDVAVTLILKLTMLSDGLWGLFACFGHANPESIAPIYSHSVGFMAVLLISSISIINTFLLCFGRPLICFRHAVALTAAAVSHPIVDFFYHPAFWWPGWFGLGVYPVVGDWQLWDGDGPAGGAHFLTIAWWVDFLTAFIPYILWRKQYRAGSDFHRVFRLELIMWCTTILFNMPMVYGGPGLAPHLNHLIQRYALKIVPCQNYYWWWTPWSWAVVLIPMHYIEKILKGNLTPGKGAAADRAGFVQV